MQVANPRASVACAPLGRDREHVLLVNPWASRGSIEQALTTLLFTARDLSRRLAEEVPEIEGNTMGEALCLADAVTLACDVACALSQSLDESNTANAT